MEITREVYKPRGGRGSRSHYLNILMSALSIALALVERSTITLNAIVLLIEF